jgi:hypothetical protein
MLVLPPITRAGWSGGRERAREQDAFGGGAALKMTPYSREQESKISLVGLLEDDAIFKLSMVRVFNQVMYAYIKQFCAFQPFFFQSLRPRKRRQISQQPFLL